MTREQRTALWVSDYDIDYSPSILNLAGALADRGPVDLYARNVNCMDSHLLAREGLTLVVMDRLSTVRVVLRRAKRLLRRSVLGALEGKLKAMARPRVIRLRNSEAAAFVRERSYTQHVCIDPQGLLLCKELCPDALPVYYCLELYLLDELEAHTSEVVQNELRRVLLEEGRLVGDIAGLIIQSQERAEIFVGSRQVPSDLPVFLLPVTYREPAVAARSRGLHSRLRLAPGTRIALHLGGMTEYYGSLEIARQFARIPGWAIFFQGNHDRAYLREFCAAVAIEHLENIYVSRRFYDDLDRLDPIMMGCDLGVAWYANITKNLATAGQSSGKIAAYLRFGLPILTRRYPSTMDAVERPGCGRCVEETSEIPDAVRLMEASLEEMATRCRSEYERKYRFGLYDEAVCRFIAEVSAAARQRLRLGESASS